MEEARLLKCFLNHDFYLEHKHTVNRDYFENEVADIFDSICHAHEKYAKDLSTSDVRTVHTILNPTQTEASQHVTDVLLNTVSNTDPYSLDLAGDVIKSVRATQVGRRIAEYGISLGEGKETDLEGLKEILESIEDDFTPKQEFSMVSTDVDDIIEFFQDKPIWAFNIPALANMLKGLHAGHFAVVLARPEIGKTAFPITIIAGPSGFAWQGAKVCFICNEEAGENTVLRSIMASCSLEKEEVLDLWNLDKEARRKILDPWYNVVKPNVEFCNDDTLTINDLEAFIKQHKPDVLVVDQLDKVFLDGYEEDHRRLRELYRRTRNLAKKYNCVIIAVSQASADGEGHTVITYSHAEGSKTGKAAEADVFIGIGARAHNTPEEKALDDIRYITLSKNKATGILGTRTVTLDKRFSRYAS